MKNNSKKWKENEILYLKNNYNVLTSKEISNNLDRSYNAVINKAFELKISKKNINSKFNTITRICTHCKLEYPKTKEFFTTFTSKRDGEVFQTKCKRCEKIYIQKRTSTIIHSFKGILRKISSSEKRMKNGFDLDLEFLLELWNKQNQKCAISGIEMTTLKGQGVYFCSNVSVDKINPNLGYIKSNIQLVCSWANSAKSNLSMKEFSKMIELTHNKLNK
jgi:hypothetical protein